MDIQREWKGIWIKSGLGDNPAPYLRRCFHLETLPRQASIFICSAGWHRVLINGKCPDDRVLTPGVSQYDRRVFYVEYDITALLQPGENCVLITLGNALYNDNSNSESRFALASWRDTVKLLCDVTADGATILKSDQSWRWAPSPITYNNIRCGERYDATKELPGVELPGFDDSTWSFARTANPPGGIVVAENAPPCRVCHRYAPAAKHQLGPFMVTYDFGVNLTGRCRFTFRGRRGKEVRIFYGERLRENGDVDREHIALHTAKTDSFQEERYTLKGDGEETWHSHFAYHGFRAVKLRWEGPDSVEIVNIEAEFIHTDFQTTGTINTSNPILNRLQEMTRQSYLSNFTGIPTDCPHREKNGWTGDAHLAMQTGCWNFDVEKACTNFLTSMADVQRPSGQVPCVVPTGGFGWNWGNGPAWDAMLLEYPWQMYLFYGNTENIQRFYPNFKRYLEYLRSREEDGILNFGMSDWACWEPRENFVSTAFYIGFLDRMIDFAQIAGKPQDIPIYQARAAHIRQCFNRKWHHGDGKYHGGEMTSQAMPLYFNIVEPQYRHQCAQLLHEVVVANGYHPSFGILGAKMVPRVLAENGFAEAACRMFSQTEYPGWGFWAASGSTTLWEGWSGTTSLNHIMYGDVSAWMFEYLAGLKPDCQHPAFKHFTIQPNFVEALSHVTAQFQTASGGVIKAHWHREGEKIHGTWEIPADSTATLLLPGCQPQHLAAGEHTLIFNP